MTRESTRFLMLITNGRSLKELAEKYTSIRKERISCSGEARLEHEMDKGRWKMNEGQYDSKNVEHISIENIDSCCPYGMDWKSRHLEV